MRAFPLALTLVLLAAGCTSPGEGDEVEPQQSAPNAPEPAPAPPATSPEPTPSAASPATSGAPEPAPREPEIVTVEDDATAAAIVHLPGQPPVGAAVVFAVLDLPRPQPTRATLVVTWTSDTPVDGTMIADLYSEGSTPLFSGSGTSPLTIEVPLETLGKATKLRGIAYPAAPGADAQMTADFALTLTYA